MKPALISRLPDPAARTALGHYAGLAPSVRAHV